MKKIALILAFAALLLNPDSQAQTLATVVPDTLNDPDRGKEFANPSVEGTPRGRFLVFRYERQFNYDFNSRGHHLPVGERQAQMKNSNIAEIKGFIPLWNRPHLKAILGVGYEREEFNFKRAEDYEGFAYHENLESKGLKSLSGQLALLRPINYKNFWVLRVKGQLNGDYTSSELDFYDYLRVTSEALYGWKVDKNFSWGIGVQFGYTYGRRQAVPAILFNKTFNNHWGLESVFPANVTLRYRHSDATFLYAGYGLAGYSYVLKVAKPPFSEQSAFNNLQAIELRHNEVKFRVRLEQEIYDFIWFSLEGGYRINMSYDTFEEGSKRQTKLIKTEVGNAPFAQAEVYFVVPKKIALKR